MMFISSNTKPLNWNKLSFNSINNIISVQRSCAAFYFVHECTYQWIWNKWRSYLDEIKNKKKRRNLNNLVTLHLISSLVKTSDCLKKKYRSRSKNFVKEILIRNIQNSNIHVLSMNNKTSYSRTGWM